METLRRQHPSFPSNQSRAPLDFYEATHRQGAMDLETGLPKAFLEHRAEELSPVCHPLTPGAVLTSPDDAMCHPKSSDVSSAPVHSAPGGGDRAVPLVREASGRFGIVLGSERFDKAPAPVAPKYSKARSLNKEKALPQWTPAGMPSACQSPEMREGLPRGTRPGMPQLYQGLGLETDEASTPWELHGSLLVHQSRSGSPILRGSAHKALPVIRHEADDVTETSADANLSVSTGQSSAPSWPPMVLAPADPPSPVTPRRAQHGAALPPRLPRSLHSPSAVLSAPSSRSSSPTPKSRISQPPAALGFPINAEPSHRHGTQLPGNSCPGSPRRIRTKKLPGSGLSRLSQVQSDATHSGHEEPRKLPTRLSKASSAPSPLDPPESDVSCAIPSSGYASPSKPAPLPRLTTMTENEVAGVAAAPASPRSLGLASLAKWQEQQGSKLNSLLQRKGEHMGTEGPNDHLSHRPQLPTGGRIASAMEASLNNVATDDGLQTPTDTGVEAAALPKGGSLKAGPTRAGEDLRARVLGAHLTAGKHKPAGSDSDLGRFFTPKSRRPVPGSMGEDNESLAGYRFKPGQDVAQLLAIQQQQGKGKQVEGPLAPFKDPSGKPRLHQATHSADLSDEVGDPKPLMAPIGLKEKIFGSGSLDLGATSVRPRRFGRLRPDEYVLEKEYDDVHRFYVMHSDKLGSGQFGVIRKCKEIATGKIFACKTLDKKKIQCKEDAEDIRREVACLSLLKGHPTVVRLKDSFEDKNEIHLVMELCKGGDLFDRIKARGQLAEADAARLCRALVEALLHCHCLGVMHRDIKLENILMTSPDSDSDIKLVDFGVATFFQPGCQLSEMNGTREYMAPEVLKQSYGPKADVWSAGIVLYIILSGIQPFWASSRKGLDESILNKEPSFKSKRWAQVSDDAKDVIRKMLTKDPSKRPSASAILSHPWFQKMAAA